MTNIPTMSALYQKLSKIGLNQEYIRQIGLPSWWNDELNDKPLAILEGAGHIARRLNLDLKSLLSDDESVRFKPLLQTKYYNHQDSNQPSIAPQIASRVAEVIASGIQKDFIPLPQDINQIRSEIIQCNSQINLDSILNYCWQHGIAVVYLNNYPEGKITGMIQWQYDRPAIVLSSKQKYHAWLAFHLAHELGHLALGHIKNGILIDDNIDLDSSNCEEIESNRFAVNLLVNNFDNYFGDRTFRNAEQLKKEILELCSHDSTIDPRAIALNYAWHNKQYFPCAIQCLNLLNSPKNGNEIINQSLEKYLDWDCLSDDNSDYLDQLL